MSKIVILHNIRSVENVGSIFRTADGAGVKKLFLTGYTPAPKDRFGRTDQGMRKTALGATEFVSWEQIESAATCITTLKEGGYRVVAVEQHVRAVDYRVHNPDRKVAYIFGNEVAGVPEDLLELADAIIEIPMQGRKESLNVAVAAGIILFHTNKDA
jgi:tRNA G18 (ribose-2'-O)-methylase SpoU